MSGAITAAAVVAAGSAYAGYRAQSSAARDARHASERAAGRATDTEYAMFQEAKELQKPFYESAYKMLPYAEKTAIAGYNAYPTLLKWASDTNVSPLALLQLKEGTKRLNQQLAARGSYNSGTGLDLLSKYSQEVLATEADKKYGRLLSALGLGMGQSTLNVGSNAATSTAGNAVSTGQSISNIITEQGVNTANSLLAQGNARSSLYSSLGKTAGTVIGGLF